MSDEFPVFGANGKLLGNLTSSFGVTPSIPSLNSLPSLPSLTGIQTASNVSPGQTTGTPQAPASADTKETVVSQYFVRTVIIILGFIFVAVGLTMFGARTAVGNEVIRTIKNHPSLA